MSKRSIEYLTDLARPMLKEHGTLSVPYIMRKLKVDYDEALKIMNSLGIKTREQEIDSFVQRAKEELKDESNKVYEDFRQKHRHLR